MKSAQDAGAPGERREFGVAAGGVGRPFFFVPGNHDIGNETMLSEWRRRRGEPYYEFVYKDVLFLCLDTEDPPVPMPLDVAKMFAGVVEAMKKDPVGTEHALHDQLAKVNAGREHSADPLDAARFSDRQVAFVRKALQAHKDVHWTFLIMHKPAWKTPASGFERIEAMLADRPYSVIAGHQHYFSHDVRQGRDYIVMGTAGAISHQEGPGKMDHFAWVTVTGAGPRFAMIKLDGLLDVNGASGQTLGRPRPVRTRDASRAQTPG